MTRPDLTELLHSPITNKIMQLREDLVQLETHYDTVGEELREVQERYKQAQTAYNMKRDQLKVAVEEFLYVATSEITNGEISYSEMD